jgi:hypothetical protein
MRTRIEPRRERRLRESAEIDHHGDTEIRRRVRGWLVVALLLAVGALPASAAGQEFKDVRIAGTFNNWATNDDAYRLTKAGDRCELVRFWPCGGYEFKFVFDGTWDKHFGDTGGGQLGQPGENITLAIPQSGEYAVWLDVQKKRWGCERRPATHPHAVIIVRNDLCPAVILDGGASVAREGHPIKKFSWTVESRRTDPAGRSTIMSSAGMSTKEAEEEGTGSAFHVSRKLLDAAHGRVRLVIDDANWKTKPKWPWRYR